MEEPKHVIYKMSNLHLLDWGWTPEVGSPAHDRSRYQRRCPNRSYTLKMHVVGSDCYWTKTKNAKVVSADDFGKGRSWEKCSYCMEFLRRMEPVKKKKREIPLEVLKPGGYVEPLNYTKAELRHLDSMRRGTVSRGEAGYRVFVGTGDLAIPHSLTD